MALRTRVVVHLGAQASRDRNAVEKPFFHYDGKLTELPVYADLTAEIMPLLAAGSHAEGSLAPAAPCPTTRTPWPRPMPCSGT